MASKAKSGLTATRQIQEKIVEPPNTFAVAQTSFTTGIRDGRGHSSLHAGALNTNPFTLKILHSWLSTGPFTLDHSVASVVDSETGKQVAEVILPVTKRFIKIVVDAPGGLMADFELGAYFLPRTPVSAVLSGTSGAGTVSVIGSPGTVITTSADAAVGVGATVPLTVPPSGTRRMRIQVTGGDSTTRVRVREAGGAAGSGDLLALLGSTLFGGADGAIAAVEVENVAGPVASVMIQFERN